MFVTVRFFFDGGKESSNPKIDFWTEYARHATPGHLERVTPEQARKYEEYFRSKFTIALAGMLYNERYRQKSTFFYLGLWRSIRRRMVYDIEIVAINYGSMEATLSVLGIANDDVKYFFLSALEVFAPQAFRTAMGADVPVKALVEDVPNKSLGTSSEGGAAKPLERAWIIANVSLIPAVLLALAVCYFAYSGLLRQMDGLREEASSMRNERVEIVKAIVAQNAKLSDSQSAKATSAEAGLKELNDILAKLLKLKLDEKAASPKP